MKKMKAAAVILFALVVLMAFAACSQSNVIAQPSPVEGAETLEVTGSCTVEKTGADTVKVICTTNLMEGTIVAVCLDTYAGENIATNKYTKESEAFYSEFTVPENIEGQIFASLVVMPTTHGKQPKEVRDVYGSKLENLTGEYVIWNTEGNCVVIMSDPFEM